MEKQGPNFSVSGVVRSPVSLEPTSDALPFKTNANIRRMATIPPEDPANSMYPVRVKPCEPTIKKVQDVDSHDQEEKQPRQPEN
ncbi:hypothetical protein MRB53_004295 [Persea americana]|uniref:Uncharacterized protein n=1 Tax=Persea americana TaxID=3435 RepID=A0ACC2MA64_PERAE|nr:hypothetical protein MRB53_004295 [Persea americana]